MRTATTDTGRRHVYGKETPSHALVVVSCGIQAMANECVR